jgi:poly [ADP-ribose] polymerase
MFKQQMKKFDLDVKKMPLGKLSANQIEKGYEVLEEIGEALSSGKRKNLDALCSKFYTVIPHSFGRRHPPPIGDNETLQQKKDMLAVLGDIALAQKLAKEKMEKGDVDEVIEVDHPLDASYKTLKCDIEPLERSTDEYKIIETYLKNTMSDWRPLKLLDVFEGIIVTLLCF